MRWVRAHAFAFACALISTGCGGIGDSYVVLVDPAFSHDEQAKVMEAISSWEAAVPVHLSARIQSCSGIQDGTICTHASTHDEVAAKQGVADGIGLAITLRENTWSHSIDGGEVFVDVPTVEAGYADDFQRVIAHEMGHAMHLEHDVPGSLMAAMVTSDAPGPTCTDEAQWYSLRGRQATRCP
jgi:hypothetical protein